MGGSVRFGWHLLNAQNGRTQLNFLDRDLILVQIVQPLLIWPATPWWSVTSTPMCLLGFVYADDLSGMNGDKLFDVLYAAKKYNIAGLVKACAEFPISELGNVFHTLAEARLFGEKAFAEHCLEYIDQNADTLLKLEEFRRIDQQMLCDILKSDQLMISREFMLWKAQKGIECSGENQREMLGLALFEIRFPHITIERTLISEISTVLRCSCWATRRIVSQKEGKKDHVRENPQLTFNASTNILELGDPMPIEKLMSADNGWYDEADDTVTVEVEVNVDVPYLREEPRRVPARRRGILGSTVVMAILDGAGLGGNKNMGGDGGADRRRRGNF
ncbi:hypothetical protein niasHT_020734 [Heterodera trifolii]|uniref:BACK domain-containing protein n=1 Tax=Heterodera trifolii TaxID=157864 RepID=A0ABD2JIY9_9BILA